jgi:DNA polymerase-3 subunit epsilon
VEKGKIQRTESRLIRPPRKRFEFTHIHGITWEQVQEAPDFREVWEDISEILDGVEFLAAHNAPFDRSVLETCCHAAGLLAPNLPFRCTVKLARSLWTLRRARLPDVCGLLGIPLNHHDATSDAQACAQIVLESAKIGPSPG